jgi:hypothetical protein
MTRREPIEKIPESALLSLAPGGAAIVTNSLTLADLLAKGERITKADLARLLATISAFHDGLGKVPAEYQGATNAPVPVEILAMIGEALAGRDQWSKIYNMARAQTARVGREQLQRRAEEIWQRQRHLSKSAVAKMIAPDRWNTVRKIITKPQ